MKPSDVLFKIGINGDVFVDPDTQKVWANIKIREHIETVPVTTKPYQFNGVSLYGGWLEFMYSQTPIPNPKWGFKPCRGVKPAIKRIKEWALANAPRRVAYPAYAPSAVCPEAYRRAEPKQFGNTHERMKYLVNEMLRERSKIDSTFQWAIYDLETEVANAPPHKNNSLYRNPGRGWEKVK